MRRVVLDVSSFQGDVDFARVKQDSPEVVGVNIKAVEGQWSATNPNFDEQYASARAAGLLTGFYCYDHVSVDASQQAQLYLGKVAGKTAELGHWLDFEADDSNAPPALVQGHVSTWLQAVVKARSEPVGVYTAPWAWDPWTGQMDCSAFPLWLSGYTPTVPPSPAHWGAPKLWQFTDSYPTYFGKCDASVILDDSWPLEADLTPDEHNVLYTTAKAVVQLGGAITGLQNTVNALAQNVIHGDATHYSFDQLKADVGKLEAAIASAPGGTVDPAPIADAVGAKVQGMFAKAAS